MRNRPVRRLLEIETNIGLNRPMLKKTHFYFACRLCLEYLWGYPEEILRIDAGLTQRHKPMLKIY